jgi:hypothetical protein
MAKSFSAEERSAIMREARARVAGVSLVEECFHAYEMRQSEKAALRKIANECEIALRASK